MILDLDAQTRLEIASMVYARWSNAFDNLKTTAQLTWESTNKFCPKGEWALYHKDMMATAQKELSIATTLKVNICKYSPLVIGV